MSTLNMSQLIEELNDLVLIHNERIEGYENAIRDVQNKNNDLQDVFDRLKDTSIEHRGQLANEISALGGKIAEGITISGRIYRVWTEAKAALLGTDRESVLETCKHGEEAAQRAYTMALDSTVAKSWGLRQMLTQQQQELKVQQNEINVLEESADKII